LKSLATIPGLMLIAVMLYQQGAMGNNLTTSEVDEGEIHERKAPKTVVGKDSGQRKFALTLAGGGARGAAHVGVLKVLEREGIKPDFVCGNSVGAMIGGLYAAGVPVSELERLVLSKEFQKAFFPINRKIKVFTYGFKYALARSLFIHPQIGLYSGKSLSNFVQRNLPKGVTNIEDTRIPFAAAAVDLVTTKEVWLSHGDLSQAIRASNSIPGFYRPLRVGDHVLVDGALKSNMPTDIAEAQGEPLVVAVRLQAYLDRVEQKEFDTILDYGDRLVSIMLADGEAQSLGDADVLIEPKLPYMRTTSYQKEVLQKAIKEGETAAERMLPKLYETTRRQNAHVKRQSEL
jgi:NTE family protein